jgi:hypothetical protein
MFSRMCAVDCVQELGYNLLRGFLRNLRTSLTLCQPAVRAFMDRLLIILHTRTRTIEWASDLFMFANKYTVTVTVIVTVSMYT